MLSSSDTTITPIAPPSWHSKNRIPSLPTHDQIARRAYEIYMQNGAAPGRCQQNWLQAQRELLQEALALHDAQPKPPAHADDDIHEPQELGSSHLHLSLQPAGMR